MKKYKYDMSIIMPIYNMEDYLKEALDSVINQDYDIKKIEIVAVNDGSRDNSLSIIEEYKKNFDNITIIDQKNQGLAKSRNNGIKTAKGKYIMYLDPDDSIASDTVSSIIELFDAHYDEIDMVTYQIVPTVNGVPRKKLHYRYNYLTKTGIYDLNDKNYRYSCITTINYCVKNLGKDNIYFDINPNFRHEDQKYANDIIRPRMKIGYTEKGKYYYRQQPNSITHTYFYAYYIFDETTLFWENTFNYYKEKVPQYFQAQFISDVNWKTKRDILKPYQYEGKEFEKQYSRILNLLNRVDDEVILNHPDLNETFKYHFINLKQNNNIKVLLGNGTSNVAITNNDSLIYSKDKININILRFNVFKDYIYVVGYISDPAFKQLDKPILYLVKNHNFTDKINIPLRESSYSYFQAKEKTTNAWLFETKINTKDVLQFCFNICLKNSVINCELDFPGVTPFNMNLIGRDEFYKYGKKYWIDQSKTNIKISDSTRKGIRAHNRVINSYYFNKDIKRWLFRKVIIFCNKFKRKIWLYYDCKGVEKDNAYYQFLYDLEKKDGIKRYYVSANSKEQIRSIFSHKQQKSVIKFNGIKHKIYYLKAEKVITAYAENNNCCPYTISSLKNYSDLFIRPELIYLQHGVLHAHTPWKYSFDRLLIDKEVISTKYEKENLIKNYSFTEEHLIESGMPRYDFVSQSDKPKNKILFAPSWRNYLISNIKGDWVPTEEKFKKSSFFKETSEFLNSKRLHKLLEKYDFELDFKLHPIFKCYQKLYKIDSDRITFGEKTNSNSDYNIFMTDYSSFVFDFVYLKRAIVYFFPDYDLFKAGLNIYRQLDLPFEDGFGNLVQNSSDAIDELEKLLKNGCKPSKKYFDRTDKFFLYNDNNQRKRIYEAVTKD